MNVEHTLVFVSPSQDEISEALHFYSSELRPHQNNSLLPFVPSFWQLLHLTYIYCTHIQHQLFVYTLFLMSSVRLSFNLDAALSCVSVNSDCDSHFWTTSVKTLNRDLKRMLSCSRTNICGTYASPFQSGIATVVSYTWDLEWWLIDDIPFELNSIAIWEYLTIFVLCIIMEHSLVPTMALLRRGIQPVSAQSWVHVFFCCNLKSCSFFS